MAQMGERIDVLSVAAQLFGEVDKSRSTAKEKHFHGQNGLFVNIDKNQWYSHGNEIGGDAIALVKFARNCGFKEAISWLEQNNFQSNHPPQVVQPHRTLVTTYDYCGPDSQPRYHVSRYSDKSFIQWRSIEGERFFGLKAGTYQKGANGWSRLNGERPSSSAVLKDIPASSPLPYRLPELIQSDPKEMVLIPGGEKDVNSLLELGMVATTNSGGEGKWPPELSVWLQGRRVCILCDNDEVGEKHQQVVGEALASVAKEIRVLRFPTLPAGGDVSDWIEERIKQDHTFPRLKTELKRLCGEAQRWSPEFKLQEYKLTCFSDVDPTPINWIWPGYVAKGKLTLLGGDPDQGKSNLTIDLASRLSNGLGLPGGQKPSAPAATIFLCSEDGLADTIRPRAEAAGANLDYLFFLDSGIVKNGKLTRFTLGSDLDLLGRAATEVKAGLVIVDAITSYMGKVDNSSTTDTRSVLDPISSWAESHNVGVIGVTHPPKAAQSNAIRQFTGSFAYVASARIAFFATKDPDNERNLLLPVKNNIGCKVPGRGYRIKSKEINMLITAPYVEWDDAPVDFSADDIISCRGKSEENAGERLKEAMDFLKEKLSTGPQIGSKCEADADIAGISQATLRRARGSLEIIVKKSYGHRGQWTWELPLSREQHNNIYIDEAVE